MNKTVFTLTTNGTGYVKQALTLETDGAQAITYQVKAAFDGTNPQTRNLTITDPYGQDFVVCTTLQYDFKSSQNSVTLTVEAPKTDTTASTPASPSESATVTQTPESTTVSVPPPKTPEQMQQEAEQGGWVQIWPEFSWSYPWFRLHVKISINPTIEVAFNPVLPGGEWWNWTTTGLQIFAQVTEEIWQDIILDLLGVFLSYAFAKGLSLWNFAGGMLAEVIKGSVQYGLFFKDFMAETAGSLKMLAIAVANFIMGLVAIGTNIGEAFVRTLFSILFAPAYVVVVSATSTMISYAAPLKIVRTPVDYFESLVVDFPIATLALLRCLGRI